MSRSPLAPLLLLAVVVTAACAAQRGYSGVFERAVHGPAGDPLADAELALADSDPEAAEAALTAVDVTALDDRARLRLQLIRVEIALLQDRPLTALQALPPPGQSRDPLFAERIERDRALALFRMGDAVGGTQALVLRERWLRDPELLRSSRDLLWESLLRVDLDTAGGARLEQADAMSRGWVELALIARSVWIDPRARDLRLDEWRSAYVQHPAHEWLARLPSAQALARRELGAVALLLPLSGPYAATAEAVRDGFLAAFYASHGFRPALRVYDTGNAPDHVRAALRQALNDGAEFVVGPLRKEDVAALVERGRPPVPVLALNYLEGGRAPPFNLYQWGLAPEDEARQAAEHAVVDHRYRAVALVPEGEWGERVLGAFRARLEQLGGAVIAARTYAGVSSDYSEPIRDLLRLDASDERHNALTGILGVRTKFEPRRRDDVDLIFIAARPDQARQLGPQFRFHRAAGLPVYATALVYDGEAPSRDLDGLRFCDMPWMIAPEGTLGALRQELRGLFPARGREFARLFALGHDAYALMALIESGQLRRGAYFPAASGTLSLREDGVITRGLGCVEIADGALRPLDLPLAPAAADPPRGGDAR